MDIFEFLNLTQKDKKQYKKPIFMKDVFNMPNDDKYNNDTLKKEKSVIKNSKKKNDELPSNKVIDNIKNRSAISSSIPKKNIIKEDKKEVKKEDDAMNLILRNLKIKEKSSKKTL